MRILIAPDGFTGTLTAEQACAAMRDGWALGAPHDHVTTLPMSDGGPGFLDVMRANLRGEVHPVGTVDPLGRAVAGSILLSDGTAWIESAHAAGLALLGPEDRDPTVTSTYGVGLLVAEALRLGARRVVVGLGGSGTNDAGAGLLAALGVGSVDRLARGGLALADVTEDDLAGLGAARARFSDVDLVLASDVDSPLLGLKGASAVFAEQKGASEADAQALENALGHFAHVVSRVLPPRRDLLTGTEMRPERVPGSGAGGGLGYGLTVLGARQASGVQMALDAVDFRERLARTDLVVTGEGSFDYQSLHGKVVVGVAEAASAAGLPVVVVPGQSVVGRRQLMDLGITGVYPVVERPTQLAAALADPVRTLRDRVVRVARTWSPARR